MGSLVHYDYGSLEGLGSDDSNRLSAKGAEELA